MLIQRTAVLATEAYWLLSAVTEGWRGVPAAPPNLYRSENGVISVFNFIHRATAAKY